jgi:hypothetical protein
MQAINHSDGEMSTIRPWPLRRWIRVGAWDIMKNNQADRKMHRNKGKPYYSSLVIVTFLVLLLNCSSKGGSGTARAKMPVPSKPNIYQPGPAELKIEWERISNPQVSFYVLYRSMTGKEFARHNETSAPAYTDKDVTSGSTYWYRVAAATVDQVEGEQGEAASVKVLDIPAAPSNLKAVGAAVNRVDLSWSDNSEGETGFRMERRVENEGSFVQLVITSPDAVGYGDSSVRTGTIYYYRALAYNVAGRSGYSNEASAYTCGWTELGPGSGSGTGISGTQGSSKRPVLAIIGGDTPVVAWDDDSTGNLAVYAKKFDGYNWIPVSMGATTDAGLSDLQGNSYMPALAVDGLNRLVLAFRNELFSYGKLVLKRLSGWSWEDVGAGASVGMGISGLASHSWEPSVAIDGSVNPYIAWVEAVALAREIYVKKWDGSAWADVGPYSSAGAGISNELADLSFPRIVTDGSGMPVVVWRYSKNDVTGIHARRFDGTNWTAMGAGSTVSNGISKTGAAQGSPSACRDPQGTVYVAWSYGRNICASKWDGTAWSDLGDGSSACSGISAQGAKADQPAIAAGKTGAVYIAWVETTDEAGLKTEIYLKKFNGTGWTEVGAGSASGTGLSNNSGIASGPAISVDGLDNPVIAWSDDVSGNGEIYARTYRCR